MKPLNIKINIMKKLNQTYYYVQALEKGKQFPVVVIHSVREKTGEEFYKFLEKKQAVELLKQEKEAAPKVKYRLVKLVESYEIGEWE